MSRSSCKINSSSMVVEVEVVEVVAEVVVVVVEVF